MIELIIFLFFIVYLGYLIVRCLGRDKINFLEALGMSFGVGLGINSLFVLFLSWFGVKITFISIIYPLIALTMIVLYFYPKGSSSPKTLLGNLISKITKTKFDILEVSLFSLISLLFISVFYRALSQVFYVWDEFSYWGLASKAMFINRSVLLKDIVGDMERYPLFLPINVASMNISYGSFSESLSKFIVPLFLVFLVIFIFGFMKRIELNLKERLLFILILLTSGHLFIQLSSALYADVPFSYFYTIAVLVFLANLIVNSHYEFYFLSGIFFALASWTKLEGLHISLISVVTLLTLYGLFRKKINLKTITIIGTSFASIPILWFLFRKFNNLTAVSTQTKFFANTVYALTNIHKIIFGMMNKAFMNESWSYYWIISLLFSILAIVYLKRDSIVKLMMAVFVVNILYLFAAYIFYFAPHELINAASFDRYLIHIFPLNVFFMSYIYLRFKNRVNIKKFLQLKIGSK